MLRVDQVLVHKIYRHLPEECHEDFRPEIRQIAQDLVAEFAHRVFEILRRPGLRGALLHSELASPMRALIRP